MNRRMNLPAVAKIMREFEKQNERMEMTSEMMGDAGRRRARSDAWWRRAVLLAACAAACEVTLHPVGLGACCWTLVVCGNACCM